MFNERIMQMIVTSRKYSIISLIFHIDMRKTWKSVVMMKYMKKTTKYIIQSEAGFLVQIINRSG